MFAIRYPEMNPTFLLRVEKGSDFSFEASRAEGLWYRVFPSNIKEIHYLQMLIKNIHILAPAEGGGVLVRADSLPI